MESLNNNCRVILPARGFGGRVWRRSIAFSFIAGLQVLLAPRLRGEDHFDYRYDDYQESDQRIHVKTHSAFLELLLNSTVSLNAQFVYDGISGATPTGGPP